MNKRLLRNKGLASSPTMPCQWYGNGDHCEAYRAERGGIRENIINNLVYELNYE